MRKSIIIFTVLVLTLLLSGTVVAQGGERCGERGMRDLGLDKDQIEQFEKARIEHRLEMIDLRAEQRKLRLTMHTELRDGEPDRAELERLVEKIADVRERIEKRRLDHLLAVRKVLNDDQWKQFLRRHHAGRGFDETGLMHSRVHGERGSMRRGGCMMSSPAHGARPPRGGQHGRRNAGAECGRVKI
ncbi:MAG TPA: periplasmic heavy metal sensor [Patescibacteria group bacterium]|nr:periplasmic heavy metal sensor [Patescibacteria group bacterium]